MHLAGLGDDCSTGAYPPGTICGYDSNNNPIYNSGTTLAQIEAGGGTLSPAAQAQALAIENAQSPGTTFNPATGVISSSVTAPGTLAPVTMPSTQLVSGVSNNTLLIAGVLIVGAALFSQKR
jgi:hypothetical protein